MTRGAARSEERRSRPSGSVIAALVFNASLLILPFAGASLVQSLSAGDLINYAPTPETLKATRNALATEASRFVSGGAAQRREQWNNLIAREMAEDDVSAARGFALSAYALLGGSDAAKVRRAAARDGGDIAVLDAALPLIEPPFARQRFRAIIGGARLSEGASFDVLGDARETSDSAQRWLAGEPVDNFLFVLGGVTLPAPGVEPGDVRLGASVLKIAKNNARLTPQFSALMDARIAAAVPEERLRAEFTAVFSNRDAIVDEGAAAALAFARARDPAAWDLLSTDLAHIGAAARQATPGGAAQLLTHVRTARDLKRLELLATATGERAVAVGKRTPQGLVLNAARGAVRWSERLVGDIISVTLSLLGVLIATHLALMNALRREWEGAEAPEPDSAPISKAEAQRRARDGAASPLEKV
jgi:hypothetical protein